MEIISLLQFLFRTGFGIWMEVFPFIFLPISLESCSLRKGKVNNILGPRVSIQFLNIDFVQIILILSSNDCRRLRLNSCASNLETGFSLKRCFFFSKDKADHVYYEGDSKSNANPFFMFLCAEFYDRTSQNHVACRI